MGMDFETARMPVCNEAHPGKESISIMNCTKEAMAALRNAESALVEVIRLLFGDEIGMANIEDGNSIADYIESIARQAGVVMRYSEALAEKLNR